MTNYAYLRISSERQDINSQKHGILEYCNERGLTNVRFVEDTTSGRINWRERPMNDILKNAQKGDTLIVSEFSRLGRNLLQILEILEVASQKGTTVHIVKNRAVMDGSMQSYLLAASMGMASQIERDLISMRTKEGLARRRKEGVILGRPKGASCTLKLDKNKDVIIQYLKKGVSKASICKILECAQSTLWKWTKTRKIYELKLKE